MASRQQASTPPRGKTQYVYDWLREQILTGELGPGEPIRQMDVAKRLGVSPTPVREAIRQLHATGMISHHDNHGAAVTELSDEAVVELYLLRGVMEGLGARLAAERRDEADLDRLRRIHGRMLDAVVAGASASELAQLSREFHALVASVGGPHVIAERLERLWSSYPIPYSATMWADKALAASNVQAHQGIIDALAVGDGDRAAELMERHIGDSAEIRAQGGAGSDDS